MTNFYGEISITHMQRYCYGKSSVCPWRWDIVITSHKIHWNTLKIP